MYIYRNEAYLLEDNIKKEFKSIYQHLNLTITLNIYNDILISIRIRIYSIYLDDSRTFEVYIKDFNNYETLYQNIFKLINDNLLSICKSHFTAHYPAT